MFSLSLSGKHSNPGKDQHLWTQEHPVAGPFRLLSSQKSPPLSEADVPSWTTRLCSQSEQSLLRRRRADLFCNEVPSPRAELQALESSSECWQGFGHHRQTGCLLHVPLSQVPAVERSMPPSSLTLVLMRVMGELVRRLCARSAVWFPHPRLTRSPDPYFVGEDTRAYRG